VSLPSVGALVRHRSICRKHFPECRFHTFGKSFPVCPASVTAARHTNGFNTFVITWFGEEEIIPAAMASSLRRV
jgi:hypothetical protein